MPPKTGVLQNPVIMLDGMTGSRLVQPNEVLARVVNMRPTEEGSYKSVQRPIPYTSVGQYNDNPTGIFHCNIGDRDCLILVDADAIREFSRGSWRELVSFSGGLLDVDLRVDTNVVDYPTQFCSTTNGVIIVPPSGRAYFYDGVKVGELGFAQRPSAPAAVGPRSSDDKQQNTYYCGINDIGYAVDALKNRSSEMSPVFMRGRIGTVQTPGEVISDTEGAPEDTAQVKGYLMSGRHTYRFGWQDWWGNQSAWSEQSNDVVFERQASTGRQSGGTVEWLAADAVRKQIAADNLPNGPLHTMGKNLARTRDSEQTGDRRHYVIPGNVQAVSNTAATIPDNVTDLYPDNIPDAWLGPEIVEYDPMPAFRLACVAMGRLWIANWPGAEGAVRPSVLGRWGTLPKNEIYWPDPTGSEVTGMIAVPGGLIVTTETSTFLFQPSPDGRSVNYSTISSVHGCIAPKSMKMIGNGLAVWLSRDGFCAYTPPTKENPPTVQYMFEDHRDEAKYFNQGLLRKAVAAYNPDTGEYMCALAQRGSVVNDHIWTFDGNGWHERDGYIVYDMCTTADHRKLVVFSGLIEEEDDEPAVFVIDRGLTNYMPALVESGWMMAMSSVAKASVTGIRLWVRETGTDADDDSRILVESMVDWRADVRSSKYLERNPKIDTRHGISSDFYDNDTTYETAKWRKRRPYWVRCDLGIQSCEVFKFRASCPAGMELLGFQFEFHDRNDGDARLAG